MPKKNAKRSPSRSARAKGRFKEALLAERERLRARLRALDATGETDGSVQDSIDAATDASIRDVLQGLATNETDQLRRVENALEKIAKGTYGRCEGCGGPIEIARLEALPFAVHCVACQRKEEQRARSARR
jgi:DnaK suppressor protein